MPLYTTPEACAHKFYFAFSIPKSSINLHCNLLQNLDFYNLHYPFFSSIVFPSCWKLLSKLVILLLVPSCLLNNLPTTLKPVISLQHWWSIHQTYSTLYVKYQAINIVWQWIQHSKHFSLIYIILMYSMFFSLMFRNCLNTLKAKSMQNQHAPLIPNFALLCLKC